VVLHLVGKKREGVGSVAGLGEMLFGDWVMSDRFDRSF
jgi:hypothetical protein